MDLYLLIFANSFKSSVIFFFVPDIAWFSALMFGGYDMWLATIAAVCGSAIGNCLNFAAGYYIGTLRGDAFAFSEKTYQRLSAINRYTMYLLLLPFSSVPVLCLFWGLYVVLTGFFGAPISRAVLYILIGRIVYYSVYLLM